MYSYEIQELLKTNNWIVSKEDYFRISDVNQNCQITKIKYNSFQDNYIMSTDDGWTWSFKVKIKK